MIIFVVELTFTEHEQFRTKKRMRKSQTTTLFELNKVKIFFTLLVILSIHCLFAQETGNKYNPADIFNIYSGYNFTFVDIKEELNDKTEIVDHAITSGPHNPITNKSKTYLIHTKYQFDNGQIISLDVYIDTIYLFREFTKTFDQQEDSLISSGMLKRSRNKYTTFELELLDVQGYDSLAMDTVFSLVPDGFWTVNIDHRLIEVGHYVDGKKEGDWHTIIGKYTQRKVPPIIRTTNYKDDKVSKVIEFDKSEDLEFIKKNLFGKWYNEGAEWYYSIKCIDENICDDFYVKNKEDVYYNGRARGFYNHFTLLDNNLMEYIIGSNCSTGRKLENREWSLNDKGQLILNERTWKIEYFTKDRLIISKIYEP